jgi:head-tail adaptor
MFGRQRSLRNPGRFNCLLTLQPSTAVQGDAGDTQPEWDTADNGNLQVHGAWVKAKPNSQDVMAQTKFSGSEGRWEIPWMPGIDDTYRVKFEARLYRIVGIDNLEERNRELHLYCAEDEGAKGISG